MPVITNTGAKLSFEGGLVVIPRGASMVPDAAWSKVASSAPVRHYLGNGRLVLAGAAANVAAKAPAEPKADPSEAAPAEAEGVDLSSMSAREAKKAVAEMSHEDACLALASEERKSVVAALEARLEETDSEG